MNDLSEFGLKKHTDKSDHKDENVSSKENICTSIEGEKLKKVVEKNTTSIFSNAELLSIELKAANVSQVYIIQIALLIDSGCISKLVALKSDFTMVDVNIVICDAIKETGLKEEVIVGLVSDVLYSVGYNSRFESGPVLKNDKISNDIHVMMPSSEASSLLKKAKKLIENPETYSEGYTIIRQLASAGVCEAFYLIAVEKRKAAAELAKDNSKGIASSEYREMNKEFVQFASIASQMGEARASAMLGDFYYGEANTPNYTLAHYYYTKFGAIPINAKREKSIKEILKQFLVNRSILVMNAFAFICGLLFVCFFHNGVISGAPRLVPAVVIMLLNIFCIAASFFYNKRRKFDSVKRFTVYSFILWSIYFLILVLS